MKQHAADRPKKLYRGVTYMARDRYWFAAVKLDGDWIHIGHFKDQREAAVHWDVAVRLIRGSDAVTNFKGRPPLEAILRVKARLDELGIPHRDNL